MRENLSVLKLLVRNSLLRVLGILLLVFVVGWFHFVTVPGPNVAIGSLSLEQLFPERAFGWHFSLALYFVSGSLIYFGSGVRNKEQYTLCRLSISERSIWFWQVVYHTSCFFLVWVAELLTVLILSRYYFLQFSPASISGQTLFLAFSRNRFLHSLLPLQNSTRMIRNIVLLSGLGITSATEPYAARRGGNMEIFVFPLLLLILLTFVADMGAWGMDLLVIGLTLALTSHALWVVWKGGGKT